MINKIKKNNNNISNFRNSNINTENDSYDNITINNNSNIINKICFATDEAY